MDVLNFCCQYFPLYSYLFAPNILLQMGFGQKHFKVKVCAKKYKVFLLFHLLKLENLDKVGFITDLYFQK